MRDALMAQPKGVPWVVATGTLTNVALLFATFPEVAEHIQGLSLMGGAIGEGFTDAPMSRLVGEKSRIGNVTPWAEFNIYVRLLQEHSLFGFISNSDDHHSVTQSPRSQYLAILFLPPKPLSHLWILHIRL
jgi:hypothetical protein